MPTYRKTVHISVAVAPTFAFVSDFSNSGTWDPRVVSARRTDGDGPLGVGSSFVLVSKAPIGTTDLPYKIVTYEPDRRVVFEGQTWYARYRDDISFAADGNGTALTYNARFDLRGLLCLGNPIMSVLFRRIGDDAVGGIAAAVERNAG
jgi:hypothetical protein